jgi:hypothetical protein
MVLGSMNCSQCSMPLSPDARFCNNCGLAVAPGQRPAPQWGAPAAPPVPPGLPQVGMPFGGPIAAPVPNPAKVVRRMATAMVLIAVLGIVPFFFLAGGCSSTEGAVVSQGQPLGDFTFTPKECKSGQHEGFHGVFLLPEADNGGGIKIVNDPVRNTWVIHVEVPGSCSPTCKVVTLDPTKCATYDVAVERTNTTVNDIRLLDGRLNLRCSFEDGSASANVKFEGCD